MTLDEREGEALVAIYHRMADEARYRPAAPSDGMGHITVPLEELDLDDEAYQYAVRFSAEHNRHEFWIGAWDWQTREAFVFAIEAARMLAGAAPATARKLLLMAADSIPADAVDTP